MKKQPFIRLAALASSIALLAGCAPSSEGGSSGEVSHLDLAYYGSPVSAYTERYVDFTDQVRDATDGELDILVRPEGELPFKPSEYVQRVGDGSIDMAGTLSSFATGECPAAGVAGLPFLVTDGEEWKAMSAAASEAIAPCLTKFGAEELWSFGYPSLQIFGVGEAPRSIEDLAGLQIRQTGPEWSDWILGIGASPVTIETAEVGGALQQGVIDAVITTADTVKSRWAEEIDWVFLLDLGVLSEYAIVNTSVLDALSPAARTGLESISAEYLADTSAHFAEADVEARNALENESNIAFVVPSEQDRKQALEVARAGWESWASALAGDEGIGALEALRQALGK